MIMKNRVKNTVFLFIVFGMSFMSYTTDNIQEVEEVSEADMVSIEREQEVMKSIEEQKKLNKAQRVVATMYYAVESQCDSDPLITANMSRINPNKATQHHWIAVSRNLLKKFHYGQKVKLVGCGKKNGVYTIVDTMNPRFKNKIDILETQGTPLYKYNNVKIIAI